MNDTVNFGREDVDTMNIGMSSFDPTGVKMTGEIRDRIFKNGQFVEERVGHNIVVNTFLPLVMSLLKKQTGYSGIQYWAVGSGNASWDTNMPTPVVTETQLTSEIGRVAIPASEIVFLDSDFEVTNTPTNIIQITHTFGTSDCNGSWREFGLFGGNATTSANSGYMINKKHHSVLTKTADMTVERTMRFTLTLN